MELRGWQLFPRAGLVRLRRGTRLDLGGIAKGWTVDRVSEGLIGRRIRAGQLNAGGDLRVWSEPGLPAWEIEAALPDGFASNAPSFRFALRNGAAATSSTLRRQWATPGGNRHHLIDPRSGLPAASDTVQCTVVGTTAAEAEIAAKTVLLLGSEDGLRWLERTFPLCDALLYKQDGTAIGVFGKHGDAEWKEGGGIL
ncbi:FAD:protein FMN transferase [Cohnella faecalis]|nr:FAD:protein FMN transferase [Cohnella faecalis]RIE00872.1 FAD:protein FMN transferase [Cohnella faecalis]